RPLVSLSVDMRDVYAATHWAMQGRPPGYHTPDEDVYLPGRNVILLGKASVFCAAARVDRIVLGTLAHNPFPDATPEFRAAMARNAQLQFQEIINLSPALSEQVKINALNTDQAGKLADLIGANLNLNLDERQHLLEMKGVKERLTHLLPLMSRELEVLTLGSKIQKEVATSMSKSQRDFFLREQMRAIQRELGEGDPNSSDVSQLREAIEKNGLPEEVKKHALKELDRLQQIPFSAAEYTVSRNYLDWIVNLPWNKSTE